MINVLVAKDFLQIKQFINIVLLKNKINDNEVVTLDFNVQKDLDMYLSQIDLFSTTKLFIVHNANFLTNVEDFKKHNKLFKIIDEFNHSETLIYLIVNKKVLTNAEITKLTKAWKIDVLKEIDKNEKAKIVNELLKNEKIFLDKDVYNYLLQCLDNCYGNIYNEIRKLANLLKSSSTNQEMIELISNYNTENIFNLFEAIITKNHKLIWTIYDDLFSHHEDEISIINAIASQAHNLFYILSLLRQHYSISAIAELTNISIYFINLYKNKFMNYNIDNISNFLSSLYKLEIDIKLSKVDKSYGFKHFLLKMSY